MHLSRISLRTFIHNLYNLFVYDYHQFDLNQKRQMEQVRFFMATQEMQTYFNGNDNQPYLEELQFIKENGICNVPYKQLKRVENVETGYDTKHRLPFVVHNGKRLFFPKDHSLEEVEEKYRKLIEIENILGGGFSKKAPHQYQTECFKVEEGDVFVDVGSAEGLVALDVVERASRLYIIESDRHWIPALKATFEPYKDKCAIIHKKVSGKNSFTNITLDNLLRKEHNHPIFIKMDIEGSETQVLEASKDYLSHADNIKIACCTYHKHSDAKTIASFFSRLGYQYEFSEGWMMQWLLEEEPLLPPFFRHGLLRAWKSKSEK